jgi:fumarate hydratase, class II
VCDEVISGALDTEFPLYVFQTGSGTQSNMNVNEVISKRCIQLTGGTLGSQQLVHPNDHVNMGQSSNDTFPTAMHIAAYTMATGRTIPALRRLRDAMEAKAGEWSGVVKIGRTHLEDAVPLTVGQEWSGYAGALRDTIAEYATGGLLELAMGGTAVGTGLNAPAGFGQEVAAEIASMTDAPFKTAANKFTAQGTLDRMVRAHAGLKAAAVSLFKIANDLRWLGSGPRTGIHELLFPENEPGSSIMPGKVNGTTSEAGLSVPRSDFCQPCVQEPTLEGGAGKGCPLLIGAGGFFVPAKAGAGSLPGSRAAGSSRRTIEARDSLMRAAP